MSSYLLSTLVTMMFAAQATPAPPDATTKDANSNITLSGCVTRDPTTPGAFTFADAATGARYRMSGVSMRKCSDQRVEIVGKPADRALHDPRRSLSVTQHCGASGRHRSGTGRHRELAWRGQHRHGRRQLPTFRVMRVRSLSESCH
jgi:hypothetical protein